MVVANRIIPEFVSDPFFARWKENQQQYRQEIHDNFSPLPIKEVPLYSEEMCGLEALDRLKETLYPAGEDPAQIYYKETTLRVVQEQSQQYSLEVYLPGIEKHQIELSKTGDELTTL
jgi:arsenite-transporting ATPase